jgi:pimeloyl-ACP methyl ester carboxylesterase
VVRFLALDCVELSGRWFGEGSTVVVLAHMGNEGNSQEDWRHAAELLADHGIAVLTFNRRSSCSGPDECSERTGGYGEHWRDVVGAAAYARARGATKVIVGGASIGAMASLEAVLSGGVEADGVIWAAGLINEAGYSFSEAEVAGIAAPILVISAEDDRSGAGPDAHRLAEWATDPTLVVVPGRLHGTELWTDGDPDVVAELDAAVLDFLAPGAP